MSVTTRSDPPSLISTLPAPSPRQTTLLPARITPTVDDGAERARAAADLSPARTSPEDDGAGRSTRREDAIRRRALRQARQREALEQAAREREQAFLRALATSGIPLR